MLEHPWKLVGPWYRSESVGGANDAAKIINRHTRPVIQKYADSNFANAIIQEPQRSLRFNSEDFVNPISFDPNQVIGQIEKAKSSSPFKLFLDMHSRFYVIVCELHCDAAGFPSVDRSKVCEAGFVVRRRVPKVTPALRGEVSSLLRQRAQLQKELVKASLNEQKALKQASLAKQNIVGLVKSKSSQVVSGFQRATVQTIGQQLTETVDKLNHLAVQGDIDVQLQGWVPAELKGVGHWQQVSETPEDVQEQRIPLYPLIADPQDPNHSASCKTLWFGVIPTSSADVDTDNTPRFDDADLYEIRCFVRRHHSQFPIQANKQDCCGDIIWSEPTEGYQLASHYDLDGTSHRPVNIKLPDLPALKAQANLAPPGRGASARIIAPAESSLNFKTDSMDMPEGGEPLTRAGQQICFFSIFLFFIVAMFLFRLFLPILLFIFNLWFLLKLKFCIPPSIEFDAGLVADLSFDGSFGVEFDASIQAHVDLMVDFTADLAVQIAIEGPDIEANFLQAGYSITVNQGKDNEKTYTSASALQGDLSLLIANGINATDDMRNDMVNGGANGDGLNASLSLNELAGIFVAMQTEYQDSKHPELAGELPTPETGLVYFDKIEQRKVAA